MPPQALTWIERGLAARTRPYRFILPALILVGLVFVYPIASGFETSLHEDTLLGVERPFVGVDNYVELVGTEDFRNALANSLIFVVGTLGLGMVMALSFAMTLYKLWFGRKVFRALSLVPWLVSGVAVATMWKFMFTSEVGMVQPVLRWFGIHIDTWLGSPDLAMIVIVLANVWYIVPFGTLILLAGIQMVDTELLEAAAIDGANAMRSFRHIILPAIAPQVALTLVYFSFASWNTFDIVLAMTRGGPGRSTEVLSLLLYRQAFERLDFSTGAAIMMVLLLINAAFSIFYLKSLRTA